MTWCLKKIIYFCSLHIFIFNFPTIFQVLILLVATFTYAQASVLGLGGAVTLVGPANPGALIQGPAAHAAVLGPDGSAITAAAQAGAVAAAPIAGGVVSAAVAPGIVGVPGLIGVSPLGLGLGIGHGLGR